MTIRLRYDLIGPGWAGCVVEMNGQTATVSASYLSDALDELCRATVEVLIGWPRSEAAFQEEPGEYRWLFDRVGEHDLRIRLIDGVTARENPSEAVLIDSECRAKEFAGALVAELCRLLEVYGEEGYLENWVRFPFPSHRVAQLRALL
jgi:hypothetical protein